MSYASSCLPYANGARYSAARQLFSPKPPNPKQLKTVQPDALAKLETTIGPASRESKTPQRALQTAKGDAILLENLPPEVLNVADAASPDVDGDDLAGLARSCLGGA